MINRVAIEGIDGSGKTTVARALARSLATDGLKAVTFAPYRLANERLGQDIYPLWQTTRGAKAAIGVMKQVFADCESQAIDEKADVVIFDRHWMTAFTEIGGSTELRSAWGDNIIPAALLRVTNLDTAYRRMRNDESAAWSIPSSLVRYADIYDDLAHTDFHNMLGVYRSNPDVSPESIAHAIHSDMYYRR